jgi:hypothetical protein
MAQCAGVSAGISSGPAWGASKERGHKHRHIVRGVEGCVDVAVTEVDTGGSRTAPSRSTLMGHSRTVRSSVPIKSSTSISGPTAQPRSSSTATFLNLQGDSSRQLPRRALAVCTPGNDQPGPRRSPAPPSKCSRPRRLPLRGGRETTRQSLNRPDVSDRYGWELGVAADGLSEALDAYGRRTPRRGAEPVSQSDRRSGHVRA